MARTRKHNECKVRKSPAGARYKNISQQSINHSPIFSRADWPVAAFSPSPIHSSYLQRGHGFLQVVAKLLMFKRRKLGVPTFFMKSLLSVSGSCSPLLYNS